MTKLLLFLKPEVLNVDGFHLSVPPCHGWFLKILAGAQLADRACLLELPLESLQRPFDVFPILYWNYDHNGFTTSFSFAAAKLS